MTGVIEITPYDSAPWVGKNTAGFRSRLEVLHDGPHNWVGGIMATASSPEDPVFWLHHSNVDRLWAIWQREHPNQPYLPANDTANTEGLRLDDPMHEFIIGETNLLTPRDVLNQYEYDNYSLDVVECSTI